MNAASVIQLIGMLLKAVVELADLIGDVEVGKSAREILKDGKFTTLSVTAEEHAKKAKDILGC